MAKHILVVLLFMLAPGFAHAATVSFDPQDSSAGVGETFVIAVNFTSEEMVNAFDIKLAIPPSLRPIDVSDGNSVITHWVEKPRFDEASRILSFSGIVPIGFSGEEGRLVVVTFMPSESRTQSELSLHTSSAVYIGEGEAVPLLSEPLVVSVVLGKENMEDPVPDTDAPEEFDIYLVREELLAQGQLSALFSTTDKGSGIARYEIKESWFGNVFPTRGWKTATSPYVVRDQSRASHIYVRAVDKAGNSITAHIPPERLPYAVYILPAFIIAVIVFWYVRRTRVRL